MSSYMEAMEKEGIRWQQLVRSREGQRRRDRATGRPCTFEWLSLVDGKECHGLAGLAVALRRSEGTVIVRSEIEAELRLHRIVTGAVPSAPRAEVKVHYTASEEERARRSVEAAISMGAVFPRVTPLRNDVPKVRPGSSYKAPLSVNWEDWPSAPRTGGSMDEFRREYMQLPSGEERGDAPADLVTYHRNCRCVATFVDTAEGLMLAEDRAMMAGATPQAKEEAAKPVCDCRKPHPVEGTLSDLGRWYDCAGCGGQVSLERCRELNLAPRPAPGASGKPFGYPMPAGAAGRPK